jgi:phosphatidylserine/phosphatidylglycerophosphate/cardiolipin synthase-like enzyme
MRRAWVVLGALLSIHCGANGSSPDTAGDAIDAPDSVDPDWRHKDAGASDANDAARPPNTFCQPTDPRATPVAVSVLPDSGEAAYTDLLNTAQKSIRVFGYQMGYGAVLDTLQAKAQAGIDVRVILDGNTQRAVNDKYRAMLEAAGAKFEWSNPQFSYMHAKTLIVDEREVLVSTGNYGKSFMLKERNYTARITDPQDVGDLLALFEADWSQTTPDLSCTRLIVSPVNSETRLADLVKSATKTLVIESMQYDDRAVVAAVLERKQAGVDVRVLLAAPSWISANTSAGAELVKDGIPAKWLASPAVHVKSMIIDGKLAYLGSENISYTSLTKNREIGVFVSDAPALASMNATFETDWAAATSF